MRKKPDKVKMLQGNFRQDRAGVTVEVEAAIPEELMFYRTFPHRGEKLKSVLFPESPAWLDEVGKQTWGRVTAITDKVDLTLDVETLATFCDCYSHLIKCSQVLRTEGYTVISDGLQKKINPAVNALRELQKTLIEAGKQLCLSVDARSKAGIVFKQKELNPLEEFLRIGRANNERGKK